MGQTVHHGIGDADRMDEAFPIADRAAGTGASIHDPGVEFDFAERVGVAADATENLQDWFPTSRMPGSNASSALLPSRINCQLFAVPLFFKSPATKIILFFLFCVK